MQRIAIFTVSDQMGRSDTRWSGGLASAGFALCLAFLLASAGYVHLTTYSRCLNQ
jgi:hypothetical protein